MAETLEPTDHPMTGNEITVVSMLLQQLALMEQRITMRLDSQANAARQRWLTHDEQHDDWEKALRDLSKQVSDHLEAEEDKRLVFDTRWGPWRKVARFAIREWRAILGGAGLAGLAFLEWLNLVTPK